MVSAPPIHYHAPVCSLEGAPAAISALVDRGVTLASKVTLALAAFLIESFFHGHVNSSATLGFFCLSCCASSLSGPWETACLPYFNLYVGSSIGFSSSPYSSSFSFHGLPGFRALLRFFFWLCRSCQSHGRQRGTLGLRLAPPWALSRRGAWTVL